MKFTAAQVALFKAGISFVHMAPSEVKVRKGLADFKAALDAQVVQYESDSNNRLTRGKYDSNDFVEGRFMLCVLQGASSEHVPVMFVDGINEEFYDLRALEEAMMIPAPMKGIGPMVIR